VLVDPVVLVRNLNAGSSVGAIVQISVTKIDESSVVAQAGPSGLKTINGVDVEYVGSDGISFVVDSTWVKSNYYVYATLVDEFGNVHDRKKAVLSVNPVQSVPVPELPLFLVPLVAIAMLFLLGRKTAKNRLN
jgi:hypothetical protein